MLNDDIALLHEYARNNSEAAFAELVSRHVNLVYSVALRSVRDPLMAEEVTQAVFIILARKADSLSGGWLHAWLRRPRRQKDEEKRRGVATTSLAGWLCRTARYASANALTIQRRRQHREQEAYMQNILAGGSDASSPQLQEETWHRIAPLLDGAMEQLGQKDHDALVLRFFEGRNFREVGAALGASEDAAKMRVNRALEKLRKFFTKRGVTLSSVAIAGTISANSVQAAPIGLAATISTMAIKTVTGVGAGTTALGAATKTGASFGSAGAFLPILGSFYFTLKASLEEAKSPRERQFIVRFYWIQVFSLLMFIALIAGLLTHIAFMHNEAALLVIAVAFLPLAYLFMLAKYAKYRRRQIQIEDCTWVEAHPMNREQRMEFSAKLRRHGSKGSVYLFLGMACSMFALAMIQLSEMGDGWGHIWFLLFLSGFTLFLCVQAWRSRPR